MVATVLVISNVLTLHSPQSARGGGGGGSGGGGGGGGRGACYACGEEGHQKRDWSVLFCPVTIKY